jgi:hypothetical protein
MTNFTPRFCMSVTRGVSSVAPATTIPDSIGNQPEMSVLL